MIVVWRHWAWGGLLHSNQWLIKSPATDVNILKSLSPITLLGLLLETQTKRWPCFKFLRKVCFLGNYHKWDIFTNKLTCSSVLSLSGEDAVWAPFCTPSNQIAQDSSRVLLEEYWKGTLGLEHHRPAFKAWLLCLLAVWPWALRWFKVSKSHCTQLKNETISHLKLDNIICENLDFGFNCAIHWNVVGCFLLCLILFYSCS